MLVWWNLSGDQLATPPTLYSGSIRLNSFKKALSYSGECNRSASTRASNVQRGTHSPELPAGQEMASNRDLLPRAGLLRSGPGRVLSDQIVGAIPLDTFSAV